MVALLACGAASLTTLLLAQRGLAPPLHCPWRRITGWPGPLCGGTRAALALFTGDPLEAMGLNPLAVLSIGAAMGWAVLRLCFGRKLVVTSQPGRGRWLWMFAALAVGANWVHVVHRLG